MTFESKLRGIEYAIASIRNDICMMEEDIAYGGADDDMREELYGLNQAKKLLEQKYEEMEKCCPSNGLKNTVKRTRTIIHNRGWNND